MNRIKFGGAIFLFLAIYAAACFMAGPLLALQTKTLKPSGILQLDDGTSVSMAGIEVPQESLPLLSVILAQKDIHFEPEKSKDYTREGPVRAGYIFVQAFEIDFPFKPHDSPRENRIMINELLLSLGLARVDQNREFKFKKAFLKTETQAREQGMGVWSYEGSAKRLFEAIEPPAAVSP